MAGIPSGIADALKKHNLGEMFSQDIGWSFSIAYKKYKGLIAKLDTFIHVVQTITTGRLVQAEKSEHLDRAVNEIEVWLVQAAREMQQMLPPEFSASEIMALEMTGGGHASPELLERSEKFRALFHKMNTRDLHVSVLRTCNLLAPYRNHIEDIKKIQPRFLDRISDGVLQPLSFAMSFNVVSFTQRKYILTILHMLWGCTHGYYELYKSPDVDPEVIREQFLAAIEQLEKCGDLASCKDGFRLLRNSVDLYVQNYDTYTSPDDPSGTNVLISFIQDITNSQTQKKDMRAKRQLMQIIGFINRKTTQATSDAMLPGSSKRAERMDTIVSASEGVMKEIETLMDMPADDEEAPVEEDPKGAEASEGAKEAPKDEGDSPAKKRHRKKKKTAE